MDSKKLYAIIGILVIALTFLAYKFSDTNNDLDNYKSRYKNLSILYLNEIMDAPKLEAPSAEDMKISNIDFELIMLQFIDLNNNIFRRHLACAY